MSLKARIRALEVKAGWLERHGEQEQVRQTLRRWESTRQIVKHLSANPAVAARFGVTDLVRPERLSLADALARGRAAQAAADAAQAAAGPPARGTEPPPAEPPKEEPPPEESPSEAPPSEESSEEPASPPSLDRQPHEPPQHLQVENVTWRWRGPQDDYDDDDEDGEYDPLRDA
jgi:hypothetical protein